MPCSKHADSATRRCGEIGKHSGLRFRRPQGLVSSSLVTCIQTAWLRAMARYRQRFCRTRRVGQNRAVGVCRCICTWRRGYIQSVFLHTERYSSQAIRGLFAKQVDGHCAVHGFESHPFRQRPGRTRAMPAERNPW